MRTLTTAWNHASYADAASFLDIKSGTYVTIPADEPTKSRSMADSVIGGDYATLAANRVPATLVTDAVADAAEVVIEDTVDIEVTVDGSAAASAGVRVTAVSADPAICTVSPAKQLTDANGVAVFTVTGVTADVADVVFAVASNVAVTATVEVTVTAE